MKLATRVYETIPGQPSLITDRVQELVESDKTQVFVYHMTEWFKILKPY